MKKLFESGMGHDPPPHYQPGYKVPKLGLLPNKYGQKMYNQRKDQ